jgi:lactoylglutathione lyase
MTLIGKDVGVGVCIYAGEMESMVRFYRDILGFHTQWDGGDFAEFDTASGALSFFMYSRKAFVKAIGESYIPPRGINQTFEIAFWLPSFGDVDTEYKRLSNLGVPLPTGEPKTFSFGIRSFYVADPEGNLLEICSTKESKRLEENANN